MRFQSTLPARGATRLTRIRRSACTYFNPRSPHGERHKEGVSFEMNHISIHAPRTGSDQTNALADSFLPFHFNPRSPHGERLSPPLAFPPALRYISIHAPRTGSDATPPFAGRNAPYFNPRSPHGERQRKVTILSIRIIGFAQKVYHKTVLLRISLAENAVILPKRPQNPVRTSLQKAGGLRFARAIRAARPYSISSPSGA